MSKDHLKPTTKIKSNDFRLIRSLKDGDVVVFQGTNFAQAERLAIIDQIKKIAPAGDVLVLFVNKMSDVKILSEAQMRNYGWERSN